MTKVKVILQSVSISTAHAARARMYECGANPSREKGMLLLGRGRARTQCGKTKPTVRAEQKERSTFCKSPRGRWPLNGYAEGRKEGRKGIAGRAARRGPLRTQDAIAGGPK